jgi:peptide/nickel transport system ATP-binding protein
MKMSEMIHELKNLSVRYNTDGVIAHAVRNVTMAIGKGEIVGLAGETGAGKTTTALAIMRLLPRYTAETEGKSLFEGNDLLKVSEKEMRDIRGKKISMIFQDPMTSLNPVFRVGTQIGDVIRLHNVGLSRGEVENRVNSILEIVGIPASRKNEYPHQFSGGMKQRVMIAIAIACSPQLLIADEPTTALDVTIQAQVINLMRQLQKSLGSSVLLITHDLGLVANFCDKVLIMYAGEIVESGMLEDLYTRDRPHHPYTLGLFGSLPDINSRASRLTPIKGLMPHPSELPPGCSFHPRCPECRDKCREGAVPVWKKDTHTIQCHLFAGGESGHE